MAMPEITRFVMVALVAMVAYRFMNELQPDGTAADKPSGDKTPEVATLGHAVDAGEQSEGEAASVAGEGAAAADDAKPKKAKVVGDSGANGTEYKYANLGKNQVVIEYCTSWQYKGTFNQVQMIVQTRAMQDVAVRGAEYPPAPEKQKMAQAVFVLQIACFGFLFFGEGLLNSFKIPVPPQLTQAKENMFAACMLIWLIGNMIQGQLLSTGAFEIHHGGQQIWSSLEEKRLPNMGDIITAFKKTGVEFIQPREEAEPH